MNPYPECIPKMKPWKSILYLVVRKLENLRKPALGASHDPAQQENYNLRQSVMAMEIPPVLCIHNKHKKEAPSQVWLPQVIQEPNFFHFFYSGFSIGQYEFPKTIGKIPGA